MPELRDKALLLRSIPYSDSSLILHCLTSEYGRISLMARGARRAKSPFRAGLMPLYQLNIRWRMPKTGDMGTLLEVQRLNLCVPEPMVLSAQLLLAKASSLFPDGVSHGYTELSHAFHILAERPEASGLPAAIWYMLESSGWVADFEHCWHCSEHTAMASSMYWWKAHLLCETCSNQQGIHLSSGCQRSLSGHLNQANIRLTQEYIKVWNIMIHDAFKANHIKL